MRALFAIFFILLPISAALAAEALGLIEAHGLKVRVEGVSAALLDAVHEVVLDQLSLTKDGQASAPLADDLAFFVQSHYQKLGRPDAEVTWSIADGIMVLRVGEGTPATIGRIVYEGNTTQKEEDLNKYLLRPTREVSGLGESEKPVPFIEARLREGAGLVQRFYQSEGFLDAVVALPEFIATPGQSVRDVVLRITEGTRCTFGEQTLGGDLGGQDKAVQALIENLRGEPFNEVKVETVRASIANVFSEDGRFSVVVKANYSLTGSRGGEVPVRYDVQAGPRFRITKVEIAPQFSSGARRLIQGSFSEALGDFYLPGDLEIMHRRTLDTEVFSRLDIKPIPSGEDTLTLSLSGTEAKPTRLAAYVGYETYNGPIIGFEARRVNIFDSGMAAQFKAELNGRGGDASAKLIDPVLFNTPNSFDLDISAHSESFFDTIERSTGVRGTLRRKWGRHYSASVFGEFSLHKIESDIFTEEIIGPTDYKIALTGATFLIDFRNSPLLPSKGWMASAAVTKGTALLGGNVNILRTDLAFAGYQPLTSKLRTSFSARTSAIRSPGGIHDVPLDLRLFNGGGNSVRSFPEQEMDLTVTSVGGTVTQTFNIELSYEIIPNLEIAAFADAGLISRTDDSLFALSGDLHYAAGIGLRYKLPFGPFRMDYGYNLNRQEGEPMGALHITFGFPF